MAISAVRLRDALSGDVGLFRGIFSNFQKILFALMFTVCDPVHDVKTIHDLYYMFLLTVFGNLFMKYESCPKHYDNMSV